MPFGKASKIAGGSAQIEKTVDTPNILLYEIKAHHFDYLERLGLDEDRLVKKSYYVDQFRSNR